MDDGFRRRGSCFGLEYPRDYQYRNCPKESKKRERKRKKDRKKVEVNKKERIKSNDRIERGSMGSL